MRAIETIGTIDAQGHIQLDTPQPEAVDRRVRIIMLLDEAINLSPAETTTQKSFQPRIPGQDQGKVWISENFNDPLPDEILNNFLNPL
jgi:hypothetical protein